jgi:lipoprotein-anchoring transpeptidase ErfK/SrfK
MVRLRELAFVTTAALTAMTGVSLWHLALPSTFPSYAEAKTVAAMVAPARAAPPKPAVQTPSPPKIAAPVAPPVKAASAADEPVPDEDDDASPATAPGAPVASEAQLDAQADDVAERLRSRVPASLMSYFDVVLYVSKADAGPWAQHMFVFYRADNGDLVYEKNFPVSTGRERHEKYFTSTPAGIFELDPARFETMHYSHTWNGAPMAWAMFLNASNKWRQFGIALHSAGPHIAELGHRASGGCVRLPPKEAEILFHRFEASERGQVPVLAVDQAVGTTSRTGEVMRGPSGLPLTAAGYKVLLVIEDYPGGPALIAVLS